eukprot:gene35830-8528_t
MTLTRSIVPTGKNGMTTVNDRVPYLPHPAKCTRHHSAHKHAPAEAAEAQGIGTAWRRGAVAAAAAPAPAAPHSSRRATARHPPYTYRIAATTTNEGVKGATVDGDERHRG